MNQPPVALIEDMNNPDQDMASPAEPRRNKSPASAAGQGNGASGLKQAARIPLIEVFNEEVPRTVARLALPSKP
jgi:hypothetical protein